MISCERRLTHGINLYKSWRLFHPLMKSAGVTEELKARDQTAWVGLVNNCRARVEEIRFAEFIYQ